MARAVAVWRVPQRAEIDAVGGVEAAMMRLSTEPRRSLFAVEILKWRCLRQMMFDNKAEVET